MDGQFEKGAGLGGDNWDLFRIFLAIVRSESISGAARSLGLSQPTVSRRLKELEERFAFQLVDRTMAGVRLTAAGQTVYDRILRIEEETLAIARDEFLNPNAMDGPVTVTVPEGIGQRLILPLLPRFREEFPAIELRLLLGHSKLNLLTREADVAVRMGDPVHSTLIGRRVATVGFGLFLSRTRAAEVGTVADPRDLNGIALVDGIGPLEGVPQTTALRDLFPRPPGRILFDNLAAQVEAVRLGLGIGALPRYMGSNDPDLTEVLPGIIPLRIDCWVLSREDMRGMARVRATTAFLAGHLKADLQDAAPR